MLMIPTQISLISEDVLSYMTSLTHGVLGPTVNVVCRENLSNNYWDHSPVPVN